MTTRRLSLLFSILITTLAISCTTAAPPPPEPVSATAKRLIDPATGAEGLDPAVLEASATAWQAFRTGHISEAERQWQKVLLENPSSPVATVGLASVAIARDQFERAEQLIATVPPYPAANVLRAEILVERGHVVEAAELLRDAASLPAVPSSVSLHYDELRDRATAELSAQAAGEQNVAERIEILRRAVELSPRDSDLRLRLVEDLLAQKRYPEARTSLQPMVEYDAALNRVQAALAEIEISEGKHQSAIKRYERLVERTGDSVYRERLENAKRLWHESTLPQQFHLALRSPNITREQLAVLLVLEVAVDTIRSESDPVTDHRRHRGCSRPRRADPRDDDRTHFDRSPHTKRAPSQDRHRDRVSRNGRLCSSKRVKRPLHDTPRGSHSRAAAQSLRDRHDGSGARPGRIRDRGSGRLDPGSDRGDGLALAGSRAPVSQPKRLSLGSASSRRSILRRFACRVRSRVASSRNSASLSDLASFSSMD